MSSAVNAPYFFALQGIKKWRQIRASLRGAVRWEDKGGQESGVTEEEERNLILHMQIELICHYLIFS